MSEEADLTKDIEELEKKVQECVKNKQQIQKLTKKLESIQQEQDKTQSANQQAKESQLSEYKRILHLKNFYIDDPLYTPFYIAYCENMSRRLTSVSIPLFSESFTVKKYNKKKMEI